MTKNYLTIAFRNLRKFKVQNPIWILGLAAGIILFQACNSKKQRLEAEEPETEKANDINNALLQSSLTLDTIIPNPGIKYKESRKINPSQPPVVLDFTNISETKDLDVADYFSTVKYVKLKYPFPDKGGFLCNTRIHTYYSGGSTSMSGIYTKVWLTSENIVAGDRYMGYHCYDLSGNYQYTIASLDKFPDYDKKKNEIQIQYDPETEVISSFSILDDNCLVLKSNRHKAQLFFHHIPSRNNYLKRPVYIRAGGFSLLSPESFVDYVYSPRDTTRSLFLYVFDSKGDTLCRFMSYNPKPALKNSANTNPDYATRYYYNGVFTIRQAYNDTIYRLKSASELQPAYILNFGKQKLDIQTALYGDKAGKLIPNTWLEANDFIIFVYTENYDCPNTREKGSVKFLYSYYDKKERKLYQIPAKGFFDDYWMKNSLENGIPFTTERVQTHNARVYASFSKRQLEDMIKDRQYSSIPTAQQEQIRTLAGDMTEDELLIMILE
jgi:hypothetical protein